MCYNITYLERRIEKYAERYNNVLPDKRRIDIENIDLPTIYFVSGFTHPQLPVVKNDGIFLYEWGLIPFWVKDAKFADDIKSKTLNAMGETVFQKPSFKNSIKTKRCLLGINGFFEWHSHNNSKYPFLIKTKCNEMFSLGCIYESWTDKTTGEIKNTFSIITTSANPLMEKIHNVKKRMPLIINEEDEEKWVDPKLNEQNIRSLIHPYDESDMTAYSVSKSLNYAKNDRNNAESHKKVDYPELDIL